MISEGILKEKWVAEKFTEVERLMLTGKIDEQRNINKNSFGMHHQKTSNILNKGKCVNKTEG